MSNRVREDAFSGPSRGPRNNDMMDDGDLRAPDLNADVSRRRMGKKRVCKFCAEKEIGIDYKDPQALKYFVSERGKMIVSCAPLKVCWAGRG